MESTVNEYDGHAPAQKVHKLKFYMGGDMDKKPFVELLRKVVQEGDKEAFDKIQGEVDEIES
jgi:phosphoenolpyruvate carboxylase